MAQKNIVIKIEGNVQAGLAQKIGELGNTAKKAQEKVKLLQTSLDRISGNASSQLANVTNRLTTSTLQLESAQTRLATSNTKSLIAQEQLNNTKLRGIAITNATTNAEHKSELQRKKVELQNNRTMLSIANMGKSYRSSGQELANMIRMYATFATAGFMLSRFTSMIDEFTRMENKVKMVTTNTSKLNGVMDELFAIANRARAPVAEITSSFQRFDMAIRAAGGSQQESLRVTETMSKALMLQGATTGEQAAALLQMSQAFNKGKLDGDEFRTAMELMPSVMQKVADILGVTKGELLDLAPKGKITTDVLRKAFAEMADDIDKKHSKITKTLAEGFTVLKTNAIQVFGELNKKMGALEKLSTLIIDLSKNLDILAVSIGAVGAAWIAVNWSSVIGRLTSSLATLNPYLLATVATMGVILVEFKRVRDEIGREASTDYLGSTEKINQLVTAMARLKSVTDAFPKNRSVSALSEYNQNYKNALSDPALKGAPQRFSDPKLFNENMILLGKQVTATMRLEAAQASHNKEKEKTVTLSEKELKLIEKNRQEALKAMEDLRNRNAEFGLSDIELLEREGKQFEQMLREKVANATEAERLITEAKGLFSSLRIKMEEQELSESRKKADELLLDKNKMMREVEMMDKDSLTKTLATLEDEQNEKIKKLNEYYVAEVNANRWSVELSQKTLEDERMIREQYNAQMLIEIGKAAEEQNKLKLEKEKEFLDKLWFSYKGFYAEIHDLTKNTVDSMINGFSNAFADAVMGVKSFTQALKEMAREGIRTLISELTKLVIKLAIVAAMKTVAFGMAPGAMEGVSMIQTMSNMATAAEGGYFPGPRDKVAGMFHGDEFVVKASAATPNVAALKQLNSTGELPQNRSQVNVKVENYTSGNIEVQQLGPNDIRIIARQEAKKIVQSETSRVVAAELANPNSKASKSLATNTTSGRRR